MEVFHENLVEVSGGNRENWPDFQQDDDLWTWSTPQSELSATPVTQLWRVELSKLGNEKRYGCYSYARRSGVQSSRWGLEESRVSFVWFRLLIMLFLTSCMAGAQQPVSLNAPKPSSEESPVAAPNPAPTINTKPEASAPVRAPVAMPISSPSSRPTVQPTIRPTSSRAPSLTAPPSLRPSLSKAPSGAPTISMKPSGKLSEPPSSLPTYSLAPSSIPSYSTGFEGRPKFFVQQFTMKDNFTLLNDTEVEAVMELFAGYALELAEPDVTKRSTVTCSKSARPSYQPNAHSLTLRYKCGWFSRWVNITTIGHELLGNEFISFVNGNLENVTRDLQALGLPIKEANRVDTEVVQTPAPTISEMPSPRPSNFPTTSLSPSAFPSTMPSFIPTEMPSTRPSTGYPTKFPTILPTTPPPIENYTGAIIGVVLGTGFVALVAIIGAFFYFRKQREAKMGNAALQEGISNNGSAGIYRNTINSNNNHKSWMRGGGTGDGSTYHNARMGTINSAMGSPNHEPLGTKGSLLSEGDDQIGLESGDEADGREVLQDEFDEYKDKTLEQFRMKVEGSLNGFEGVMSAAVTKALMGDDDFNVDPNDLLWGCDENPSAGEIEASSLCEVNDWLKRNDSVSTERRRVFMKSILNRMVTSVRFGILRAEDAARSVHEAAALLSLPLKNELPMTTILVIGMRKTINASQMVNVLQEFGAIDEAAVASGNRGFGIVRFRSIQSVDRALRRYRDQEIVVQDVAIQLKVLKPSGTVIT